MSKNLSHLSRRKGLSDNLFEKIGYEAQENGSLHPEAIKEIAEEYLMGTANVFGTASFYDFTRPSNKGKKVYVCNGSACLTAGTQSALRSALQNQFKPEEIGDMCCLGRCHENVAFHYQGQNYSGSDLLQSNEIFKGEGKTYISPEKYHVEACGTQILTGPAPATAQLMEWMQSWLKMDVSSMVEEIKISGLRGRGGAGFPIWIKLDGCKKAAGNQKFIVCNADEGDPGSYSDRYLLEHQIELVLAGMWIAGRITGADTGVVYIRAEYPDSVSIAQSAVEIWREAGLLGQNILDSGFHFDFKIIKAQGAYICGEETALLSSIEGQRPEVRVRPPFPVNEGLFRKPTVVNNVETLANLPYILNKGGAKYASIGTEKSTGTKLVSLDSAFNIPGIYEVDMGTALADLVYHKAKGFRRPVKALHIGGPLGGLVPVSKLTDLSIDFESFASQGFMLGHASVVSVPEEFPIIYYLEHLFEFTAHESCGKCFPCRLGSTRGKEMIQKARNQHDYKIERKLMDDLLDTMKRGSLCALGGGIPLPVMNALKYFEDELAPYFRG
ncbi:MAG: NAD(P)H-dependent oxidoreductase subunit E [Saprospiraceae bacterium]|nr:NAD(P)H-dependent oxidoreductase subunit E [Saprospiraceae bacterium]